jgi:hypothetical protein
MGNIMKHRVFSVVIALLLGLSGQVSALEVKKVKLSDGVIHIRGKNAEPFANISWEGKSVTIANKKGAFCFTTKVLPAPLPSDCLSDCLGAGSLSDGIDTVDVLVSFCNSATGSDPLTCRQVELTKR